MQNTKYSVDLPYPPLENIKPNRHDLLLILEDYSGIISEITAVTQYFYHHLYANNDDLSQIAKDLMGIAIVEMHHLDILGELIIKLGGDPKFLYPVQNNFKWWEGSIIDYGKKIEQMINADIILEKNTIINYQKHAKIAKDKTVSLVLERIILDEKLHIELFYEILDSIR